MARPIDPPASGPPQVLVIGPAEGAARTFDPLLLKHGYAVLPIPPAQALRRGPRVHPEAVLIDAGQPEGSALDTCRALRAAVALAATVTIVLVTRQPLSREERLAALRAGASDCLTVDDGEELILRLKASARATRDAQRRAAQELFDPPTGLYNRHGVVRRAQELASLMFRQHGALCCLVFSLEEVGGGPPPPEALAQCAHALAGVGRQSDILGLIAPGEFAVLAPATDAAGAVPLAQRLAENARAAIERSGVQARVRAGFEAITNLRYQPIEPLTLLLRARSALLGGRPDSRAGWLRRFDDGTGA